MEFDDEIIFFEGEVSSLEIRAEIVNPPKTAAFAAAEKTGGSWKRAPTAFAVRFDVRDELIVFFFSPSSFVRVVLLAARRANDNIRKEKKIHAETKSSIRFFWYQSKSFWQNKKNLELQQR